MSDPEKPLVEVRMCCFNEGERQEFVLRLASEDVLKELQIILQDYPAYIHIKLDNGRILTLKSGSIWFMYRLSNSYSYSESTILLGSPNDDGS